jgi:hypothetical protein
VVLKKNARIKSGHKERNMGKSGGYNGIRPAGFRSATWVGAGNDWDRETDSPISGNCKSCGLYDVELVENYCRDDECRNTREEIAVSQGRAIKIIEGLPDGKSIVKTAKGNVVVKANK